MPATIREIITEHGELLKVGEWTLTPNTRRGEYARITGFTVMPTRGPDGAAIRVTVQRYGPHTCDHPCLEITGLPENEDPESIRTPNTRPELGNCDARGNLAYFDLDPDARGAPTIG